MQAVRPTQRTDHDAPAALAHDKYPPPSYAATIWLTPQGLRLALPAAYGEAGHSIELPLHDGAWETLLSILRERARYGNDARAQRTIGLRASPVQYDIDAIMRAMAQGGQGPKGIRITKIEKQRTLTLDDLTNELEDKVA